MLDGLIIPDEHREIKKHYEPIMDGLIKNHMGSDDMEGDFKRYLKQGMCMVKNIDILYNSGQVKDRQSILRSILKENLRIAPQACVFLFFTSCLFKQRLMATYEKQKAALRGGLLHILRSRADSNRCSSFCRAEPSHSATGPFFSA